MFDVEVVTMVNPLVKSHPNGKAVGTVIDPISIVAIAVPEPAVMSDVEVVTLLSV